MTRDLTSSSWMPKNFQPPKAPAPKPGAPRVGPDGTVVQEFSMSFDHKKKAWVSKAVK